MSLDFIRRLYAHTGISLDLKKQKIIFTSEQFLNLMGEAPDSCVLIWDDIPLWTHNRPAETWALVRWYLFQKWGFME